MIINTNIHALLSSKSIHNAGKSLSKSSERLSSGLKFSSAGENPCAYVVSKKMQAKIRSLEMADRNSNDAVSLVQTMEGALNEVTSVLQRVRELSVQGATDAITEEDREKLKVEMTELVEEMDNISKNCSFNGGKLLNGDSDERIFQVGQEVGETIKIDLIDATVASLEMDTVSFDTREDCEEAIVICDKAISTISNYRSGFGAFQNRIEYVSEGIVNTVDNMKQSLSVIQDTDMAEEMINYTTSNVLSQTAMSMLAQANERPQELLGLLNFR